MNQMNSSNPEYVYDEYVTTIDNLQESLRINGVAIIPSLLDDIEQEHMRNGFWDFFEHITQTWALPLQRNISRTWRQYSKLQPLHGMQIQNYHVGQAQVAWDIRQNEKILHVFSTLWGCPVEDLLVSMDGMSLSLPPEKTGFGWENKHKKEKKSWYHTDQSYTHPHFECVQSWITANDVNEGDATLVFYRKSHIYHQEFSDTFNVKDPRDWWIQTEPQLQFYRDKGCRPQRIVCPRGSLVLWDSRLIHCGGQPRIERIRPNIRYVLYLCYLPRNQCSEEHLQQRLRVFQEKQSMSHNAIRAKIFPERPHHMSKEIEITDIPSPNLTFVGRRLVGMDA